MKSFRYTGMLVWSVGIVLASVASAYAEYVSVTADAVNIRTGPSTSSVVIVKAQEGDIFELKGEDGQWYKINMFSGEYRYFHQSLAKPVGEAPALPADSSVRRRACIEVVRAQDRAAAEAQRRYPTQFEQQIDYERLLYDRYELPIFRRFGISPARNSKLVVECAKKGWLG